jgi:hypothetical protein
MAAKTAVAELFGDAEFENVRQRVVRTKVDVPPTVLKHLKEAQAVGQRVVYPVRDLNHFEAMADVFYSAGQLIQASVIPAPVKDTGKVDKDGNKVYEVAKKDAPTWTATHVRVTISKRRGRAPGTPDTKE